MAKINPEDFDAKIEKVVSDFASKKGDLSDDTITWAVELAKCVFIMGINAAKGRFHADRI